MPFFGINKKWSNEQHYKCNSFLLKETQLIFNKWKKKKKQEEKR